MTSPALTAGSLPVVPVSSASELVEARPSYQSMLPVFLFLTEFGWLSMMAH
jgi:hypothetical protein